MKVYFYKLQGRYHAITENGYRLFPIDGADLDNANYIYEHLNCVVENRGDKGESTKTVWVYRPKTHQRLCAAILRARVMGDPAAEQYTTSTWHATFPCSIY